MPKARETMGAERALELVADRWVVMVVHQLKDGPRRYNQIKSGIPGVSQRMLTLTLRSMERDGLVKRVVYSVTPPHTEYSLTELGQTLVEPLHQLCLWAEANFDRVLAHRAGYRDGEA
jgi:DNA-binding HxlR family transcriptional regulator